MLKQSTHREHHKTAASFLEVGWQLLQQLCNSGKECGLLKNLETSTTFTFPHAVKPLLEMKAKALIALLVKCLQKGTNDMQKDPYDLLLCCCPKGELQIKMSESFLESQTLSSSWRYKKS